MIRIIVVFIEIIICYLLQSSIFPSIALANVVPDIILILIITTAFTRGKTAGMFTGLIAGLLMDFCIGDVVGLYGFLYMVVGYLNGFANKVYAKDDYFIPTLLIGASEFVYLFMYYIFEFLFRGRLNIGFYMYRLMLPRMIYTMAAAAIFYRLFQMIHHGLLRLESKEE